jgi:Ca-activated chloride channel family protein
MIKFEHPDYLYALIGLLPLLLAYIGYMLWRRSTLKRMGDTPLVRNLITRYPRFKHGIKFGFIACGFIMLCIGLANPQMGTKFEKVQRKGIDLIIALDVSRSMLSEDIKPNRIDRSKRWINRLIDQLEGDRVGMIVFAGNAYPQMPITADYSAAKLFVRTITTSMIPTQGTAIGDAIDLSREMFDSGSDKNKALVIITDGEDHEGNLSTALATAVDQGITIYTVGVGSSKGGPIPIYRNGRQENYQRDKDGNIVLAKLNEALLQQIASTGNGQYFSLSGGDEQIVSLINAISGLEQKEFDEKVFTDYEDYFQIFLLAALVLLTIEVFISERRWQLFTPTK